MGRYSKTEALQKTLDMHPGIIHNPSKADLIKLVLERKEALPSDQGFLFTTTPPESTGRSPRDTYIVFDETSGTHIDWSSPNNLPIEPKTFQMLWQDALEMLQKKQSIIVTERVIGADPTYAMPVRTISDRSLISLFSLNMFRPIPKDIDRSLFTDRGFTLLVLPYDKINTDAYDGLLRKRADGRTSNMAIIMDFENRKGLIIGSAYCGSAKKLMFTVMNYYLPFEGILPIHCSANENPKGELTLFLGLSGTGKTTLSAEPNRALLGDDEHGWSSNGIANFENGCYAKLIDLDPAKEPEIYEAVFHKDDVAKHGAIVENAMIYPDSTFDLFDDRLTPNSRACYPLSYLKNIKQSSCGPHPKTIVFLTADANGVLPPVSILNTDQAKLWFLMGYTSKLAGTETGVVEPESTFSRFFGQPFMPLLPERYTRLLGRLLEEHQTSVFLINTGWTGGPYGVGKRIDINITRSIVDAALEGHLNGVDCHFDERFHLQIPKKCPNVPESVLVPRNNWPDKNKYDIRAAQLASDFSTYFDNAYGNKGIADAVKLQCPGKYGL